MSLEETDEDVSIGELVVQLEDEVSYYKTAFQGEADSIGEIEERLTALAKIRETIDTISRDIGDEWRRLKSQNRQLIDNAAHTSEEITKKTKVFIGKITPKALAELIKLRAEIFTEENGQVYYEFFTIKDANKPARQLLRELLNSGCDIQPSALRILDSALFDPRDVGHWQSEEQAETHTLVELSARDIGFTESPSPEEFLKRAKEFHLEPCSPRILSEYMLDNRYESVDYTFTVGMEPVDGHVLQCVQDEEGTVLKRTPFNPDERITFVHKEPVE